MGKAFLSLLLVSIATLVSCIALLLTFVSAPRYEPLFVGVIACNALASFAALYLFIAKQYRPWTAIVFLLILFTNSDVGLRYFGHMRLSDVF